MTRNNGRTISNRALIAARLSRGGGNEESRIERDDEAASAWAASAGLEVVATSEDRNVSGGVSPFRRPGLGPWLTEPAKLAQYDVLVASSVDRLGHSAGDLFRLREWAEDNGKSIQVLSPPLSWPPALDDIAGPIVWDVLARVAELELRLITKRHADARETLRSNGAFFGKPPFGFQVVGERYNKRLQLRADLAPILQEMIARAFRGDTYTSIAEWLDESGISTVHGGPWSQTSVRTVLASPALKGRYLDGDGKVLHRFDGLMTSAQWADLQASLDRRPQRRGMITADTALLTGAIFCGICGGPMYRTKSKRTKKDGSVRTWFYYRCGGKDRRRSNCRNMIRLELVDGLTHAAFLTADELRAAATAAEAEMDEPPKVGSELTYVEWTDGIFSNLIVFEQVTIPGDDHADDIAECEERLRALDFDAPDFATRQSELLSERRRLQSLPVEASRVEERPTGQTAGDVWKELDDAGRRRYLLATGMRVIVDDKHTARMEGDPSKVSAALRVITS